MVITANNLFGKFRKVSSIKSYEWGFLGLTFVSNTIALIVALFRIVQIINNSPMDAKNKNDIRLAFLLIINIFYSFFYSVNGIFRERKFELYALAFSVGVVLCYVIIHFFIPNSSEATFNLIRMICSIILAPFIFVMALWIPRKFGKFAFIVIGALEARSRAYNIIGSFNSLLNLDSQLTLNSLLLMYNVSSDYKLFSILSITLGLIVNFFVFSFGFLAIRFENKKYIYAMWSLSYLEFFYLIYAATNFSFSSTFNLVSISYISIIGIALLLRIVLTVQAVFVIRSFGLQVKDILFDDEERVFSESFMDESMDSRLSDSISNQ